MDAAVAITEFTDPGCPFAYNAEPLRWRILWRYGDQIEWTSRMVVLTESPDEYATKGLTPQVLAHGAATLADEYGMPTDSRPKVRTHATRPACTAVVAVRERMGRPPADAILRALRVRNFAGELLDEDETIAAAATDAGLDAPQVLAWMRDADVVAAVDADRDAARRPTPAALALDERLAPWEGGWRYTCPSLELVRVADGATLSAPGFQPGAVYDVVLANLLPDAGIREAPASVEEVLAWAGVPLATVEVATICGRPTDEVRDDLTKVATRRDIGRDGLWTLA